MILPDTMLTLDDACKAFLGGNATPETLRIEHKRGKLNLYRIALGMSVEMLTRVYGHHRPEWQQAASEAR